MNTIDRDAKKGSKDDDDDQLITGGFKEDIMQLMDADMINESVSKDKFVNKLVTQ